MTLNLRGISFINWKVKEVSQFLCHFFQKNSKVAYNFCWFKDTQLNNNTILFQRSRKAGNLPGKGIEHVAKHYVKESYTILVEPSPHVTFSIPSGTRQLLPSPRNVIIEFKPSEQTHSKNLSKYETFSKPVNQTLTL